MQRAGAAELAGAGAKAEDQGESFLLVPATILECSTRKGEQRGFGDANWRAECGPHSLCGPRPASRTQRPSQHVHRQSPGSLAACRGQGCANTPSREV